MLKKLLFCLGISFLTIIIGIQHFKIRHLENVLLTNYQSATPSIPCREPSLDDFQQMQKQTTESHSVEAIQSNTQEKSDTHFIQNVSSSMQKLKFHVDTLLISKYDAFFYEVSSDLSTQEVNEIEQLLFENVTNELISGDNSEAPRHQNHLEILLNEDQFQLYHAFNEFGEEASAFVDTFNSRLTSSNNINIDIEQQRELTLLLVRAKSKGLTDIYGSINQALEDEAHLGGQSVDEFLNSENSAYVRQRIMADRVIEQAREILTVEQLDAFMQQPEWDHLADNAQLF